MWLVVEELREHQSVVVWFIVFGVVFAEVDASRGPVNIEVALAGAIPDPVEAHVDFFLSFMIDGVVSKYNFCGVINLHGIGGLRMSEFFECRTDC